MSLVSNLQTSITRIATEFKAVRTLIGGSGTADISGLTTTNKSSLVSAINEVKALVGAGSPTTLTDLTDVTITSAAEGDILYRGATEFINAPGSTYFQPRDADLDAIAALSTTSYGRGLLALANAAALVAGLPTASTAAAGVNSVATQTEVNTGTDTVKTVAPSTLASRLAAYAQPLDSDLTAIAALTTTSYGRGLLALSDGVGLANQTAVATTTQAGVSAIATQTEVNTGTDAVKSVTSSTLGTRLAAYAQPLDSDLTSIAALATTSYGRALLTLADQAALMGLIPTATTAVQGKTRFATTAEAQTGTDTTSALTPAAGKAAIDQRIINDSTLSGVSTTNAPSVASVKAYADGLLDANNAMQLKGVIDASANPNYPAANAGWTYKISVAGRIGGASGPTVEVGDTLYALTDGTAAGNHATVGANWVIVQTNLEGAVVGPASSVAGNLASFSGATGKVVQDSGFSVDTDGTLAANSATRVPTQSAVKAYAQPLDAELSAIAGLTSAADRLPYFTGSGTASLATFTTTGRSLVAAADAAAVKTLLALENVSNTSDANKPVSTAQQTAINGRQPLSTDLTAIAALTSAADRIPYATGAGTWALATFTSLGRSVVGSATQAAAQTALGVYSTTDIGDVNTDFTATFVAALA